MRGVTFGDTYHSYKDWGLFLKSAPVVSTPEPWTHIIEVPGMDGEVDLGQSLTGGYLRYKARDLEMEFVTHCTRANWDARFSPILNYLHGKSMTIMFDDDAPLKFNGRVTVEAPAWDKNIVSFKVKARVNPYRTSESEMIL